MNAHVNMHAARMALNRDPQLRKWAEEWLKEKERRAFMAQPNADAEAFEKHWRYVRPERMHEGATEAVAAYMQQRAEDAPR